MIRQVRLRFIRIAVIALTIAMVLVVGVVNLFNYFSVRAEMKDTLHMLSETELRGAPNRPFDRNKHDRNMLNESNWFTAEQKENGDIIILNLQRMADTDNDTAMALVQSALADGRESAFLGDYLFRIDRTGERTRILFLNCETRLTALRTLMLISLAACIGGILLALLIVTLASKKAIKPILDNMEQQKRFITDASHEMKTPLTVISANMELLRMEGNDSQWVQSTQKQVSLMRHLVDEMVYLSRLEEESAPLEMTDVSLKPLLEEAAEPFAAMAEYRGLIFETDFEDDLMVKGDRASLTRLVSTLCDNAVKYAAEGGTIRFTAKAEGRSAFLKISNTVERALSSEECAALFRRFYRADPSRSKEKRSGFGIGLAIAAAVTEKHGGSISAAMAGEDRLMLTCRLPRV